MTDHPRPRLGVVMDPIGAIKYAKDSTLAMLLAAQARGFELAYLEQHDLLLRDGVALGRVRPLTVAADPQGWFKLGEPRTERLGDLDCILMRKDPPFDTEYIYSTYILERAEEQGAMVVNRPRGLRDMNEKVYTAWFPQCCAPTLITRDMREMAAFLREHGKIVCKPLEGMGGKSIFVLELLDKNMNVVFETLTHYGQHFAIVQRYIPDIVETGDSRVLVIDGEFLLRPELRREWNASVLLVNAPERALYDEEARPREFATILVDDSDPLAPVRVARDESA